MPTENHIAAPLKVERSTVTKLVITGAPLLRLGFINLKTRQDMRQQTAGACCLLDVALSPLNKPAGNRWATLRHPARPGPHMSAAEQLNDGSIRIRFMWNGSRRSETLHYPSATKRRLTPLRWNKQTR